MWILGQKWMQCKACRGFGQIHELSSSVVWASLEKEGRVFTGSSWVGEWSQVSVSAQEVLQGRGCKLPDFQRRSKPFRQAAQYFVYPEQASRLGKGDWIALALDGDLEVLRMHRSPPENSRKVPRFSLAVRPRPSLYICDSVCSVAPGRTLSPTELPARENRNTGCSGQPKFQIYHT